MKLYQCHCCDYFSLDSSGDYSICKVCFWEDDGIDVDQPDERSSPNRMTLREGRRNFQELGACDPKMLKHVLPVEERGQFRLQVRSLG